MSVTCHEGNRHERAAAEHDHTLTRASSPVAGLGYTLVMRPRDTDEKAEQIQLEIYRRMTGSDRLKLAMDMSDRTRATTLAGIRARHPEYSEEQARYALFRLLHGDEVFRRAWPEAPLLAP